MARGDAVIWRGALSNTGTTAVLFAPGAGVEVCMTSFMSGEGAAPTYIPYLRHTVGYNRPLTTNSNGSEHWNKTGHKIFMTNTMMLQVFFGNTGTADYYFSGIQTK